jgi:hypothetical protein
MNFPRNQISSGQIAPSGSNTYSGPFQSTSPADPFNRANGYQANNPQQLFLNVDLAQLSQLPQLAQLLNRQNDTHQTSNKSLDIISTNETQWNKNNTNKNAISTSNNNNNNNNNNNSSIKDKPKQKSNTKKNTKTDKDQNNNQKTFPIITPPFLEDNRDTFNNIRATIKREVEKNRNNNRSCVINYTTLSKNRLKISHMYFADIEQSVQAKVANGSTSHQSNASVVAP